MSKGLEALKEIKSEPFSWEKLKDSLDTIENELKEYERLKEDIKKCDCWKEHKALEIIKKKDIHKTMLSLTQSADEYNHFIDDVSEELQLTQEEYDLLKEVLNYGK